LPLSSLFSVFSLLYHCSLPLFSLFSLSASSTLNRRSAHTMDKPLRPPVKSRTVLVRQVKTLCSPILCPPLPSDLCSCCIRSTSRNRNGIIINHRRRGWVMVLWCVCPSLGQ
jgi:hypothetical protein